MQAKGYYWIPTLLKGRIRRRVQLATVRMEIPKCSAIPSRFTQALPFALFRFVFNGCQSNGKKRAFLGSSRKRQKNTMYGHGRSVEAGDNSAGSGDCSEFFYFHGSDKPVRSLLNRESKLPIAVGVTFEHQRLVVVVDDVGITMPHLRRRLIGVAMLG